MTVRRQSDGAEAIITLGGSAGCSRDKRLRALLGHAEIDGLDDLRGELVGHPINVKVTTYRLHDTEYRGIER